MKIVIGVDIWNRWESAAQMVRRLAFPAPEIHLVHAIEPYEALGLPAPAPSGTESPRDGGGAGEDALKKAEAMLFCLNCPVHRHVLRGEPTGALLEVADQVNADLIAVGSESKGAYGGLFFGSVGRGLVIGARRSILVCKEILKPNGGLTAVVATDHSEYMSRCLGRLLELAPGGIDRLVAMTANRATTLSQSLLVWDVPDISEEAAQWVREKLEEKTRGVCSRLSPLGADCEARVIPGHPVEAIQAVMAETHADLLIMGAQGHSFLERLAVGSVSLHEVVASTHSVLVLRPA